MRIAQQIDRLEPGGAERLALLLAGEYKRLGHECELWTLLGEGLWAARATAMGIPVFHCTVRGKHHRIVHFTRLIRRFRPDVIHTHNVGGHPYVAVLGKTFSSARIVNTRHGRSFPTRGSYPWLQYRLTLPFTDHVIYLNEDDRRIMVGPQVRSSSVLPNGIPIQPLPALDDKLNSRRPRWTTVCRLHSIKRLELMLEAFALFRHAYPDAELHIGGEGPEHSHLLRLAAKLGCGEQVHFHGHVDEVVRFLNQFDGFLITSWSEGMPMAVLEAMSATLPILSVRLPGVEVVAPDGVAAWYAREASATAFCAIMLEAYQSGQLAQRGREARRLVAMDFSLAKSAARHLELFEHLVQGRV